MITHQRKKGPGRTPGHQLGEPGTKHPKMYKTRFRSHGSQKQGKKSNSPRSKEW